MTQEPQSEPIALGQDVPANSPYKAFIYTQSGKLIGSGMFSYFAIEKDDCWLIEARAVISAHITARMAKAVVVARDKDKRMGNVKDILNIEPVIVYQKQQIPVVITVEMPWDAEQFLESIGL